MIKISNSGSYESSLGTKTAIYYTKFSDRPKYPEEALLKHSIASEPKQKYAMTLCKIPIS